MYPLRSTLRPQTSPQELKAREATSATRVVVGRLGRLCELGLIFCCVALFVLLVLAVLFDADARVPESSRQSLSNSPRVFSNISQSGRFSNRAGLKALLLKSLLRGAWRGRYTTGRLRLHSLPSGFPSRGRLRVDSMTWESGKNRFFARVSLRALENSVSKTPSKTPSKAFGKTRGQVFSLYGEAIAYTDVVVTSRPLLHGTTLTADDLEQRSVPISPNLKNALSNIRDALGKEVRFRLSTGTVLRLHHLRSARLVRRRSVVNVVYNNGGVRVVLQARALENGVKGGLVRLRNNISGNEFYAVVVGAGEAMIYQPSGQGNSEGSRQKNLRANDRNSFEHEIGSDTEHRFADDNPFRSAISR